MSDYIRREDAKDALQEKVFHNLTDEFYGAMQVLDELEPADVVQVVHSNWSLVGWHKGMKVVECGRCRRRAIGSGKFCPNCGAKMDGGRKEETDG